MPGLRPINRWLEPGFAVAVLGSIVYAFLYFQKNAHLPQPFFYEPFDTWMDWFNTAYWAHNKGAYDNWGSVYPPLSFAFLRVFGKASCYAERSGYTARECDWVGLATLNALVVLNLVLLYLTFRKVDRRTAIWRAVALGLGLPTLFGYERGNLVVACFTCIILGFGPLLRSARLRWLFVGGAVNFKIYIAGAVMAQLIRRRWRWFEGASISVVAVYLVSFAIYGAGTPAEVFDNIVTFSTLYQAVTFLELWYATTYAPLMSLLTGQYQMMSGIIGSNNVDLLILILPLMLHGVQAMIVLAAAAAWLRPEVVPMHRLTFLAMAAVLVSAEPGGYVQNFLIFFVFLERWRGGARAWAIFASYVLCIPLDVVIDYVPPIVQESYLAGFATFFQYNVTLGPFIRPLLVQSIVVALAVATIRDVVADISAQGWRHRWRYRRDAPIMVGDGAALPPSGSVAQ